MGGNKWDRAKYLILSLPFLCLAAWLARLPLALPALVLPERLYLSLAAGASPEDLRRASAGWKEAFLVLPDSLRPLPRPESPSQAWDALAEALPDQAQIGPILSDLGAGLPALRRARIRVAAPLASPEVQALARAARAAGLPLALEQLGPGLPPSPLVSLSWRTRAGASSLPFELLLSPRARASPAIRVSLGPGPDRAGRVLWEGKGSSLPPDFVLRLEAGREELSRGIDLYLAPAVTPVGSQAGSDPGTKMHLDLGAGLQGEAKVLVISQRPEARSWIEENWAAESLNPAEAGRRDLLAYELIVLDGLPLASLKGPLLAGLLEVARRRTGSILLTADSPDFGREGDSPELEALLPVELKSRRIRDLPDLGLLLLLDTSGSMFGDKLSLAKVTGLELLAQLKPQDRVGLMLFSDERRWVYDFAPNASIKAAAVVDPVPAQGGTDLAKALAEGLGRLEGLSVPERHVVVVSDGITRPADFPGLAARARAGRISISTMGVGKDADRPLLERLARQTGGRYYPVASAEEIPSLLFEDRKSLARPPFVQEEVPIFAHGGLEVSKVTGMSLLTARKAMTVLLANALGDPLLSSRDLGNRAILVFASDLHGSYTRDFFRNPSASGILKDRLDALFAEEPLEVSLLEGGRGIHIHLASSSLVAPALVLSADGLDPLDFPLAPSGPGTWDSRLVLPRKGPWKAAIADLGTSLASFGLGVNLGLSGLEPGDLAAMAAWDSGAWRILPASHAWLYLAFASSLGSTLFLRRRKR